MVLNWQNVLIRHEIFLQYFVTGKKIDRRQFCGVQWSSENIRQLDSQELYSGGWVDGPGIVTIYTIITDTNDDNDQVLPDDMISIRRSLHNMESHTIGCGPAGAAQPDEVVRITWVDEDKAVNIGWVICFI